MSDAIELLNQLDEYYIQKEVSQLARIEAIETVYTPKIRKAVADIDAEFAGKDEIVDDIHSNYVDQWDYQRQPLHGRVYRTQRQMG